MITHHWRWRSPRFLLLCGAANGGINQQDPSDITCKRCLRIMKLYHKKHPNAGWLRSKDTPKPGAPYEMVSMEEHIESLNQPLRE